MALNATKIKYEILIGNTLFDIDSVGKCRLGVPKVVKNSLEPEEIINIKENLTIIEYEPIEFTKKKAEKINKVKPFKNSKITGLNFFIFRLSFIHLKTMRNL